MVRMYRPVKPFRSPFKLAVAKIVLTVLGRAMRSASRHDSRIKKEIAAFDEGFTIRMEIPGGPSMVLEKKDGRLKGSSLKDADLVLTYKNLQSAFLVLTPQLGIAEAFSQHRISVKGDIVNALIFSRCLVILLAYLYPEFIVKKLVKRVPPMGFKEYLTRLWIYCIGIPLGI